MKGIQDMALPTFTAETSLYTSTNRYRGKGMPNSVGLRGQLELQQLGDFCTPCWKPLPFGPGVQICCTLTPPGCTVRTC